MAKRHKNPTSKAGTIASRKPERSASPPQFSLNITVSVTPLDEDIIESKIVSIYLPITLSKLAWEIANVAFSLGEELAFKAKMVITPDKPLLMDGEINDDDITF